MKETIITGVLLALEDKLVPGSLRIRGEHIASVSMEAEITSKDGCEIISGGGCILAPGFIDLHCHGGAGGDVNDGDETAFFRMEEFHRRNGVTSFMPSLSVDPLPKLEKACEMLRSLSKASLRGRAEILGLHFESPYISPKYPGCQAPERLLPFDHRAINFIEANYDIITRITLAPELEGVMDALPRLWEMGILISAGHTNAAADTFRAAADRGVRMTTHLYNAMSSVHKEGPFRVPGVLEAALTDDRVYTECIADGYHVPAELIKIAYRCKGPDKFLICSDASRAAGYDSTEPLFICGQEAVVENGIAMLKDRSSLASSVVSLDTMIRFLTEKAGFSISQALRAASLVPAMAAGVADRKGRLVPGFDADMVLLGEDLRVRAVWCRGVCTNVLL